MLNKILVTGGSGFIGSNLIKYLLEKKYKVINVDKLNYFQRLINIRALPKRKAMNLLMRTC